MRRESQTRFLTDVDILDVEMHMDGEHMTDFSINYRAFVGAWLVVARFDTAHGRLHFHDGTRNGRIQHLERAQDAPRDRTDQFEGCMARIHTQWRSWRARLEAR